MSLTKIEKIDFGYLSIATNCFFKKTYIIPINPEITNASKKCRANAISDVCINSQITPLMQYMNSTKKMIIDKKYNNILVSFGLLRSTSKPFDTDSLMNIKSIT